MYGENGAAMRAELAALLALHRVQQRLGAGTRVEREALAGNVRSCRQTVLTWCTQAMQVSQPMTFSSVPPRVTDPFRSVEHGGAARELAHALEHARAGSTAAPAPSELLTTPHENAVGERWRRAARAAALAQHDITLLAGNVTAAQARALVGDVAAITQALVVLDRRYRRTPGWEQLPNPAPLGWSALAVAIDVNLGEPDYSLDELGWRPRAKPLRGPVRPGILGVLQAEHNLLIRLRAFPHVVNLRLVADSQRHLCAALAPQVERLDPDVAACWRQRAATYTLVRGQLRDLGGLLGTGDLAAVEASKLVGRLKSLPLDTIIEPRVLRAFQTLNDNIDHRIADIVEEGLQRGAFAQRVTLPRLETGTGRLVSPVRERYRPITDPAELDVVHTIREQLRPASTPRTAGPGTSRAELASALVRHDSPTERVVDGPAM